MSTSISPLAPKHVPDMPAIAGVRLATAEAGIRYAGRTDVLLALFDEGTTAAGVFTKSKCPSAPVEWCRAHLKTGKSAKNLARALVVNSGNANAFTGKSGRAATKLTAEIAAEAANCKASDIFLASTGVIGEPLDASKFGPVMESLAARANAGDFLSAAKAIMTTDTFPKVATARARIGKVTVTVNGIAKGAGMIAPDMATMLSFIFTDAAIAPPALQALLKDGVADTFNAVTIDGDTSTSDTLMIFATGNAGNRAHRARRRSAPEGSQTRLAGGARQSFRADRARRRRRPQAGGDRGGRRGVEGVGAQDRHVDRQFAAGEDRDRRRGRQLGPRGDGGRQGGRAGGSR